MKDNFQYKSLYYDAPVCIWEEDGYESKIRIDALKDQIGLDKIKDYLNNNNEYVHQIANTVKVTHVNKKTLEVYEAQSISDLQKNILETFTEEAFDCYKNLLVAIASNKTFFCQETTAKTLKGKTINVMLQVTIPENLEDFKHLHVSMMDISAMKKMEKEIKEIYATICKSPIVIFRWKMENGWPVDFVTNNVYELTGYLPEDFLNRRILGISLLHPEDAAVIENDVALHINRHDKSYEQEYRIITKNGTIKWVKNVTSAVYDERGNITHFQGMIRDITNEKIAKDRVMANLKRFKDLIETTHTAYIVLDTNGIILEANDSFLKMCDCQSGDIINSSMFNLLSEEDMIKLRRNINLLAKGIAIEDLEICISHKVCNHNKATWIRMDANIMENGVMSILCLIKDITAKKTEELGRYINDQKQKDRVRQNISRIRDKILNMKS